jgi:CRISPR/Cas system CMR-associated protein Cmr1 (group 7 of RAMP superfamily)
MVNVAIQEKILLKKITQEKLKLLTYSHRVELLVADDDDKPALANKCIDEQLTIKQIRMEILNVKNKPAPDKKKFIDPFIQVIINKYSMPDFSVGDIKWARIDSIKKMQAKIEEYLLEIENTKAQLEVSKKNLQLIYTEKSKPKEKTIAIEI